MGKSLYFHLTNRRTDLLRPVEPYCSPIWLFQELRTVLNYPVDDLQFFYEGRELAGKDFVTPFHALGIHHGSILEYVSIAEKGPLSAPGTPHPSSPSPIFLSSSELQSPEESFEFLTRHSYPELLLEDERGTLLPGGVNGELT